MTVRRAFLVLTGMAGLFLFGPTRGDGLKAEAPPGGPPTTMAALAAGHFSARLTVHQWRVAASGVQLPVGGPPLEMRLVRELRRGRWTTTLSIEREPGAVIDGPDRRTRFDNPFRVARMEMADGDQVPRMFDRSGRPVRAIGPDDLRLVGAAAAIPSAGRSQAFAPASGGGFLANDEGASRRAALERRFGRSTGRVRGLDRFARTDATGRHEVLVNADTVLPVFVSTTAETGDEIRTDIDWTRHGRGQFVRRLMRTEHRSARAASGRSVVEVGLSDVEFSGAVRP